MDMYAGAESEINVLIVDDDPAIRDALELLLESHGLPVETYESGQDFLANSGVACPGLGKRSCLVLDIQMPNMTGFELLEKLAEQGRSLPTIMISSYTDPKTRERAVLAGVIELLEKPFDIDRLFGILLSLVNCGPRHEAECATSRC